MPEMTSTAVCIVDQLVMLVLRAALRVLPFPLTTTSPQAGIAKQTVIVAKVIPGWQEVSFSSEQQSLVDSRVRQQSLVDSRARQQSLADSVARPVRPRTVRLGAMCNVPCLMPIRSIVRPRTVRLGAMFNVPCLMLIRSIVSCEFRKNAG